MPLQIIRNDITRVKADAIVNTANPQPIYAGGTDYAVYQAAGPQRLLASRRRIGEIEVGDVAVTPAFRLPAKYIIHAVGPVWQDGQHGEREAVRSCYEKALQKSLELHCKSIAFPLIATGTYGFPKAEALQIALQVFSSFLLQKEMMIYLVVFDSQSVRLSEALQLGIEKFIDDHYVTEQKKYEYGIQAEALRERRSLDSNRPSSYESMPAAPLRSMPCPPQETPISEGPVFHEPKLASAPIQKQRIKSPVEKKAPAPRNLEDVIKQVGETFQQRLLRLIDEKGFTDVEVYKRANLDRKLFSKIRCNPKYKPTKRTVLALAIALKLNLDETKDLLGRAELALSPSSVFDLIIEYFIVNEFYDVYAINIALFQHDQPLLGE